MPTLTELILPFLADADRMQEKTVVHFSFPMRKILIFLLGKEKFHCSGGIERSGHVLGHG